MRRFVPFVPLVAALLALPACGGGGDDGLSKAEARQVAHRAQLGVADLEDGWEKTAEEEPGGGSSGDDQLERCVGSNLDMTEDTLAESDERTFERSSGDVAHQQLVASTAVLRSEDEVDQLFRLVATEKFAGCVAQAFQAELSASAGPDGVELESGPPTVERGGVKGARHSTHISAPFTLRAAPLTLEGRADVVLVSSGQPVSLMFGFSIGEPIAEATFDRLAGRLLERQRG